MNPFKDHFSSHATSYATYRPHYPEALAEWIANLVPAPATALDCGCGSGQLSVLLAEHVERVIATDPSPQQIASAQPHARIDYRVAPAEASSLPDASVDLLTAAQAAHWFDLPAFYAEARRVLRPGGVIVLISYAGMERRGPVEAVIERFRLETLADYWPPERAIVENGYRDIGLPFDVIAAPPFTIDVEWPLDAMIGYLDTWSAVRAMEAAIGRAPFDVMTEALRTIWGEPSQRRLIRWPLTLVAGRA